MPKAAVYRVLLTGAEPLPPTTSQIVGEVVIAAPARSVAMALYRRAVAVLLREAAL